MSDAGKMWGGRFAGELDPQFSTFQKSLPIDKPLVFADLEVNRAWAAALGQAAAQHRIAALPQRQAKICCSGDADEMRCSHSELLQRQ